MSITYQQNEGSRTTQRAISGIAAGVVTVATALTSPLVGDVCEILSSTTGANNAPSYTLVAISGAGPFNYELRPAPLNQGASGNLVRLNRATARTLGATAVTSVTVLSSGLAVLRVVGANFVTNGVQPSDRIPLSGSSVAANNGAWIVVEVLDEEQLLVTAPDGGTGMTSEAVGTGSISARHGIYTFSVLDEAALSWQRFLDVGVPLSGPSGGAPNFGPSPVSLLVRKSLVGGRNTVASDTRTLFRLYGVATVTIDQSGLGTPSAWASLNELVVNMRNASAGTGGQITTARITSTGSWGDGNVLEFTLGSQPGDRYSAADGSVWCGVDFVGQGGFNTSPQRLRLSLFGSTLDNVTAIVPLGPGGDVGASIVRPTFQANTGVVESVVAYGIGGMVGQASGDQDNVLIASATSGVSFAQAGTVVEGLLLSDQVVQPWLNNFSLGLVILLNPRQDLDLAAHTLNIGAGATVEKRYMFNPTFAQFVAPFAPPLPASGLQVVINEINETTAAVTAIFTGTTNAQGKLNAGAGVELRRQLLDSSNVSTLFSHHIEVQGPGYRLVSQLFQLRAPADNTLTIPRIIPDYEGELSR